MSRWGPLAGKGVNKLESQKYFQTGCIHKILEEVEPKIFSTRLRSNEATDCHYQGVLGSFSQATWRCPVFRWTSRMIGFHGRYSYLVPHGDESSIAKTFKIPTSDFWHWNLHLLCPWPPALPWLPGLHVPRRHQKWVKVLLLMGCDTWQFAIFSKDRDENLLPLSQFVSEPHVEPQRRPNWSQAVVSQAAHQFPRFSREPLPPYVHTIELAIWAFCHASVPAPLVGRWTGSFGPGSRYLFFIYALVNFFVDIFGLFSFKLLI